VRKKIVAVLGLAVAIGGATALPAAARNVNDNHSYSTCKYNYQIKDIGLGNPIGYAEAFSIQVRPLDAATWTAGSGCKLRLRVLYKQPQTEEWAEYNTIYTENRRNGSGWVFTNDRSAVGVQRVIATVCKGSACGPSKTTTAQQ
jgi:hypothetical protein